MSEKLLFTGKAHTSGGPAGATRSSDGEIDLKLPAPHPTAEKLFASAWSACYIGALELVAGQKKITLPSAPEVDAEIGLLNGAGGFFLRAHFHVTLAGVDPGIAQDLIDTAHTVCPYSKAVHGNIEVQTTLV